MSVEPRNALWNRLLSRAEARAAKGTIPEPHHYHPVSATDDHLRSSFENSLIYHGLKIETEFNLRSQRPPRKRSKTKRKSDLPVAERLRNDHVAAGSPGPTHRTPIGTPTRRISKSTPLSRPPIPVPPPLPSIPVITRAAAARERVLNTVSDDEEPPVCDTAPVVELSDSSDDAVFPAQAKKRDDGAVVVVPHFDLAADSNDTSSWEDDAILVGQPPKLQDSGKVKSKNSANMGKSSGNKTSARDFRPPHKTSKQDRARRARARKIADSDSSLAGDSDSEKSKVVNKSGHDGKPMDKSSRKLLNDPNRSDMDVKTSLTDREGNADRPKQRLTDSNKDEISTGKKSPRNAVAVHGHRNAGSTGSKSSLLSEDLITRITKLTKKDSKGVSPPTSVFCLSSSSDEGRPDNRRTSPPMRDLLPRRRTPSNVSVEDKLFGPLSPLTSPRRRTRSMSGTGTRKRSPRSYGGSSPAEDVKRPVARRTDTRRTREASECNRSNAKRLLSDVHQTPLRKSPRRLNRKGEDSPDVRSTDLQVRLKYGSQKRARSAGSSSNSAETRPNLQRHDEVLLPTNPRISKEDTKPDLLEGLAGKRARVDEIQDADSDVCFVNASSPAKRRRFAGNTRNPGKAGGPGLKQEQEKVQKERLTKSTLVNSWQSPRACTQKDINPHAGVSSQRKLPLRIRRSLIAEKHRKTSSRSPGERNTDSSRDVCQSSETNTIRESKHDAQIRSRQALPLRIRRSEFTYQPRKVSSGPPTGKDINDPRDPVKERVRETSDFDCLSDSTYDTVWFNTRPRPTILLRKKLKPKRTPKRASKESCEKRKEKDFVRLDSPSSGGEDRNSWIDVEDELNAAGRPKRLPSHHRRRR